jgi:formylglycine-generating enzyme required for sulfatase activity
MKLRLIQPDGPFWMGSPIAKIQIFDEGPCHEVELTRAFYIGVYEVKQREYEAVMGSNPSRFKGERDSPDRPVEKVSYHMAVEFCERLSALAAERRARRVYRLPTEAEWEYACRAGCPATYYFGEDETKLEDHAWLPANARGSTHPVGKKKPNAWGLYDMYGNVWEWCADYAAPDYYRKSPKKDPLCIVPTDRRICRGGAWAGFGGDGRLWCRSAARGGSAPGTRHDNLGLRVVFTLPGAAP